MLRKINSSGDTTFTDQWNEHVEALRQLKKMRGGGTVQVTWLNGVPTILGRDPPVKVGIGKANGTISARASGAISIWGGTFGSESDTGDDTTMFNLSTSVSVALNDWVTWQVINGQYAFVKLC